MNQYNSENQSLNSLAKVESVLYINVSEKWQHCASYCTLYKLIYVKRGKLRLWCTPGHLEINEGFAILLEPGSRIRSGFSFENGVEFYEVNFNADNNSFKSFSAKCVFNKSMTENMLNLLYISNFTDKNSTENDALLYCLLCEIFKSESVKTIKEAELIEACCSYIENNLTHDFDINALANHLSVDRSHISRVFSKAFGKTLKAYVNERRVALACNLLSLSSFDISKIASLMGFEESNLFTKFFTYHTGTTPSDYRRHVYGTKPFNG